MKSRMVRGLTDMSDIIFHPEVIFTHLYKKYESIST